MRDEGILAKKKKINARAGQKQIARQTYFGFPPPHTHTQTTKGVAKASPCDADKLCVLSTYDAGLLFLLARPLGMPLLNTCL